MYQICCLSNWYWNAGGCGLDWDFSGFCFSRRFFRGQNASTCSSEHCYNRVHSFWENFMFFPENWLLHFTQKTASNMPKWKTIETKDALILKLPTCEAATVGWWVAAPDRVGTIQQSSDPDKSLKLLTFEGFTFSSTRCTYDIYLLPIWRQIVMIFWKCILFRSFWYKFVTTECKLKNASFLNQYKFATAG